MHSFPLSSYPHLCHGNQRRENVKMALLASHTKMMLVTDTLAERMTTAVRGLELDIMKGGDKSLLEVMKYRLAEVIK
jgi:hypothetical protein